MPDIKPVVFYDFASGHMAERLTEQAVKALKEYGYSNAVQELFGKIKRYFHGDVSLDLIEGRPTAGRANKSLTDADPKHMFPMFTEYVDIWPDNYFDMEAVVGKELARAAAPRSEIIPELVWITQDWLESFDVEWANRYKTELNAWIVGLIGERKDFIRLATKYLTYAGTTATEALAFKAKKTAEKPTPVVV